MAKVIAKERDLAHQRLTIGNILYVKLYFNGIIKDFEDNGLDTVLENIERLYDSGSNNPVNEIIFDGN